MSLKGPGEEEHLFNNSLTSTDCYTSNLCSGVFAIKSPGEQGAQIPEGKGLSLSNFFKCSHYKIVFNEKHLLHQTKTT